MPEGQFSMRYETASMNRGMREYQKQIGQSLQWFMYNETTSNVDDIYDEGVHEIGKGKKFKQPILVPVISTQRKQGAQQLNDQGFYTTDTIHLVVSYEQARQAGLGSLASNAPAHLNDRFIFQGAVFDPTSIWSRGILETRYHVIGIDAVEVDPDELINEPQFRPFSR